MKFPINPETHNIFNNLFAFFGTLDLQGLVTSLEGKIFNNTNIDPNLFLGIEFSKLSFWKISSQSNEKIRQNLFADFQKSFKTNLELNLGNKENISIQLNLFLFTDSNNNSPYIFFYGQENNDGEMIKAEIEEANRDKDFFLAFLSHELRSPLNTILGWTKILLTKEVDETIRKSALETIEKSARMQARLIDDLVDSAKISSGNLQLDLVNTDLFEIVKKVFDSHKSLADSKNIELELIFDKKHISIDGDSARLTQAIRLVVTNVFKVTPSGGSIKIIIETTENEVEIIVQSVGSVLSQELLQNFSGEVQQNEVRKSFTAAAMEMDFSIVKILVEKHNGYIKTENKAAANCFTYKIKLHLSNSQLKVESVSKTFFRQKPKRLDSINILLVEDDVDSREVLQLFLEQSGAEVASVESAVDAMILINKSERKLPDMIISDLAMPIEDGYSLLLRVRRLPAEKGGSIPAIALSAFASFNNKQQAYEAGFQKYHTKPFEPDNLISDILTLVKK